MSGAGSSVFDAIQYQKVTPGIVWVYQKFAPGTAWVYQKVTPGVVGVYQSYAPVIVLKCTRSVHKGWSWGWGLAGVYQ